MFGLGAAQAWCCCKGLRAWGPPAISYVCAWQVALTPASAHKIWVFRKGWSARERAC